MFTNALKCTVFFFLPSFNDCCIILMLLLEFLMCLTIYQERNCNVGPKGQIKKNKNGSKKLQQS